MNSTHSEITAVILCGGSGTRLWPLSRKSFPKQFVPLVGDKSLLQLTLERVRGLGGTPLIVGAEEHRFMISGALEAAGLAGEIILEPAPRNTAAAMGLAAMHLGASDDRLLLFCPADHHIPDTEAFMELAKSGIEAAEAGAIVTFGVFPSFPSTAYGYIRQGAKRSDCSYQIEKFIEKPDAASARQLLLEGNVLWNAGIFLCKASVLVDALERYAPDIAANCKQALASARNESASNGLSFVRPDATSFVSCRSESVDYAVMEHHTNLAVVPFVGVWSDVGSWNAVADLTDANAEGNRLQGQATAYHCSDTFVHAPHRPVVALGTSGLLIVDTPDAVLVAARDHAEQVKDVVSQLEKAKCTQAVMHRKVARPWGWYDSVDMGDRFQVKRIGVKPGASLSLQMHHHRAEHWVVVRGTAEVTRGSETFLMTENQSTYIPVGEVHRLKNPGMVELEIIEIQSGGYLGEDDIVRFEDKYGRG